MTAALIVLIVKKPAIDVIYDTMVTGRYMMKSVIWGVETLDERYNLTTLGNHVFPHKQEDLERTLHILSGGAKDLAGLFTEVRGSDLMTRFSKLAYTLDQVLGNPENRRSVQRILKTTADALETTTHEDVRSIVAAFDFSGLHECLETGERVLIKLRSLLDDIAQQGSSATVDKLVALSKDPQFKEMIREIPELFKHLTEIIKSDDFKLVVSAGGQVLNRADEVLEEAERADLVGRSNHVLSKIEAIAIQIETIVDELEDHGINIGLGRDGRVRALSPS